MVPFIDVMLVLLIIFMVSAPLVAPSLVDLPSIGGGRAPPPHVVEVVVHGDGSLGVRVDSQPLRPVALASLAAQVTQLQAGVGAPQTIPVVIAADRKVPYEQVVAVMDRLQRAGVPRVGLALKTVP